MANDVDTIPEAEIVPAVSNGPRAVMVSPTQLRKQMQRDQELREVINEYIKNNMVEGKDYGRIEVKKGTGIMSKPNLFKPGGEKFCGLFKIRPTFKKDTETFEMLGSTPGIIAYICELVDSRGLVIGEGRGTAKADPDGADFDINKQVKIAQKRAQIDAVLRTGGLSDFFTQDLEDAPAETVSPQSAKKPRHATMKQIELLVNKVKWGLQLYDKDDVVNFLDDVLEKSLDQLMMNEVDEAIAKVDEAVRQAKIGEKVVDTLPADKSDVVYDVTDAPVNLDNLPY